MKRVWMLLVAGLLTMAGSVRAEEMGGVPGTMELAAPAAPAASSCCGTPACDRPREEHPGLDGLIHERRHGDGHSRFCDWLLYKPPATHCPCHCAVTPCVPELYLWFLDMCPPGGCGHGHCGGGCAGACAGACGGPCKAAGAEAPCALGGCAAPAPAH